MTYLRNAANAIACILCVCRKAFDDWSPVPLGTITFVVALLWSMDILVKKWVRMAKASKGSIFTAKPEPGKKLPLNWKYIDTLDNTTKLNFHRLIAVTGDRLRVAGYYKMKEYPVLLLFLLKKHFQNLFLRSKNQIYSKICKFFQTTEKGHSKCSFCDEPRVSKEVEPEPPTIEWPVVVSVVIKLALYYYFYDFLSKVH